MYCSIPKTAFVNIPSGRGSLGTQGGLTALRLSVPYRGPKEGSPGTGPLKATPVHASLIGAF
ncbi:hypothetical protein CGL51_12195 [Pyrobaculum aerophilum]|nr:hypothetical protein CGL51_12195 [Pyrobaculum aerophilum]RFA97233.1 hypothetical protein CGL52_09695 [Pyrobaculum aerophilum]